MSKKSTTHHLKQLQTQRTQKAGELVVAKYDITEAQATLMKIKNELQNIEQNIKKLSVPKIVVSEHALLRYLERVYHIDMDQMRKQILSESTSMLIKNLKTGLFPGVAPNDQAYKLRVKDRVITTVITK